MTLLVIELKLPDHGALHSADELAGALAALIPKAISWALSFFVLALFWIGHHRAFAHVRSTDGSLVALNLLQLAFVSLMPFSSALSGEYGRALLSQAVFSINMALLGATALLVLRYIQAHPELGSKPMSMAKYRSARLRIVGVMLISVVALVIAVWAPVPAFGNIAFMLMAVISPLSRAIERRELDSARLAEVAGAFALTAACRARLSVTRRARTAPAARAGRRSSRQLRRR